MIKYAYTILYVPEVEKAVAFYESAFDFSRKFITPEGDYGEVLSGETTLAFASLELGQSNFNEGFITSNAKAKPFGIELVFATEEIEKVVPQAIAAGAIELEKITNKPWGQKVAYVKDPNGFLIEICTPMKN